MEAPGCFNPSRRPYRRGAAARREGIRVHLDVMGHRVQRELRAHADLVQILTPETTTSEWSDTVKVTDARAPTFVPVYRRKPPA